MISLCLPGGIHFCIHWPTAVQPLVEQVKTPISLFLHLIWKKLELGKRFQQVASPSLHPPLFPSFASPPSYHLPPHAMSANNIQPFFVLQQGTLSILFPQFLFSFFLKGELSGSPMPPIIGLDQSPPPSWLSTSEVSAILATPFSCGF